MNIHTRPSVPSISGRPKGHLGRTALFAAVAGGILVVATAVGAMSWRTDRDAATPTAVEAGAAVRLPAAASGAMVPATARVAPHTIYLVRSEDQATLLRDGITDSNAVLRDLGLPPVLDDVVVAATSEHASKAMAAIGDSNRVLFDLYRVENHIVDLRG